VSVSRPLRVDEEMRAGVGGRASLVPWLAFAHVIGVLDVEGLDLRIQFEFPALAGRTGWLVGETLWQKNWSADGLTTRWERAGPSLVRLCAARPEYTAQYRKVGSYLATQILVADLRKRLFGALLRDLRDFRAAGLIGRDIAWLWRNHRSFRRYRRAMSKPQALASLVGPPQPQP